MEASREEAEHRFTRAPRAAAGGAPADVTRAKLRDSLDAIASFLDHAVAGGRTGFARNSPAYASGSMAIIRAAALFESCEVHVFLGDTPDDVVAALRTIRNIASHGGYRAMNDDVFWATLTDHLPPYLERWRASIAPDVARDS